MAARKAQKQMVCAFLTFQTILWGPRNTNDAFAYTNYPAAQHPGRCDDAYAIRRFRSLCETGGSSERSGGNHRGSRRDGCAVARFPGIGSDDDDDDDDDNNNNDTPRWSRETIREPKSENCYQVRSYADTDRYCDCFKPQKITHACMNPGYSVRIGVLLLFIVVVCCLFEREARPLAGARFVLSKKYVPVDVVGTGEVLGANGHEKRKDS